MSARPRPGKTAEPGMTGRQYIMHVDMDAFYASIEQRDEPSLRGRPVIVGGAGKRGVVAAASYEVRKFGVHSAMPSSEARRRCPDAIFVRPRMAVYQSVSAQIFRIFRSFTPLVEGLSLDEAFLDLSDSRKALGSARKIGRQIKAAIREETALTASVGIAPNKLVAKIASDLGKPDGLLEVRQEDIHATLDPLPVRALWGIGKRAESALLQQGVHTLGQLRAASASQLRPAFGRYAESMQRRASGIDDRRVVPDSADKSISHEQTFDDDIEDRDTLMGHLSRMADATASRLRKSGHVAGVVYIKVRTPDFSTCTRQQQMKPAGAHSASIFALARRLLDTWLDANPGARLRLLGVGVSALGEREQMSLFEETDKSDPMDETIDAIREKFGKDILKRGRSLR